MSGGPMSCGLKSGGLMSGGLKSYDPYDREWLAWLHDLVS